MMTKNNSNIDIECLYKDEKFMPLLPLLDQPFLHIAETYPGITEKNFQDLILYALNWQSEDHWQAKAMSWLENGLNPTGPILDKLEDLSTSSQMSLLVKHRITTLLDKNLATTV